MTKYKGKNIRVSDSTHKKLITELPAKVKIGAFVEEAIDEKIERERKSEKVIYTEDFKRP